MYKSLVTLLLIFSATALQAENNYSGLYLGATLGHVKGRGTAPEHVVSPGKTSEANFETTMPQGLSLSARGGYSWVLQNNILWGIEGDIAHRSGDDKAYSLTAGTMEPLFILTTGLKSAASLRGRLGYLLKNDKTLLYATAGLAAANIKRGYYSIGAKSYTSSTHRQTGFTAGFGLEHSLSDALSVLGEFRYADYGDQSIQSEQTLQQLNEIIDKHEYTENSLQFGLVYHF